LYNFLMSNSVITSLHRVYAITKYYFLYILNLIAIKRNVNYLMIVSCS
jgi:hypothetical protein